MIDISPENAQFLDAAVARGVFPSHEAALDQAVNMLRERQRVFDDAEAIARKLPALPPVLEPRSRGVIGFRGHRVSLHLLLDYYFSGYSLTEIEEWLPSIPADDLRVVLDYIRTNEPVMGEYHRASQACENLLRSEAARGPSVTELLARSRQVSSDREP